MAITHTELEQYGIVSSAFVPSRTGTSQKITCQVLETPSRRPPFSNLLQTYIWPAFHRNIGLTHTHMQKKPCKHHNTHTHTHTPPSILPRHSRENRGYQQQLLANLETMTAAIHEVKEIRKWRTSSKITLVPRCFIKLLLTATSWFLFLLLCVQNRNCVLKLRWENFYFVIIFKT